MDFETARKKHRRILAPLLSLSATDIRQIAEHRGICIQNTSQSDEPRRTFQAELEDALHTCLPFLPVSSEYWNSVLVNGGLSRRWACIQACESCTWRELNPIIQFDHMLRCAERSATPLSIGPFGHASAFCNWLLHRGKETLTSKAQQDQIFQEMGFDPCALRVKTVQWIAQKPIVNVEVDSETLRILRQAIYSDNPNETISLCALEDWAQNVKKHQGTYPGQIKAQLEIEELHRSIKPKEQTILCGGSRFRI